jgi:hypothetical protein
MIATTQRPDTRPARSGVGLPLPAGSGEARQIRQTAERLRSLAKTLRPHELVAMLASHYAKARTRSLPRVQVTLSVQGRSGRAAVTLQV